MLAKTYDADGGRNYRNHKRRLIVGIIPMHISNVSLDINYYWLRRLLSHKMSS